MSNPLAKPAAGPPTLASIAENRGITLQEAFFIALLKLGTTVGDAYRLIRPNIKPTSAQPAGSRLKRRLRKHLETLGITETQVLLTDIRLTQLVATAPPDIALKASDQMNKLLGRYSDGTQIAVLTPGAETLESFASPPSSATVRRLSDGSD